MSEEKKYSADYIYQLERENEKLKADMETQLREILRLSDGQKRCYCPYCGERIK